MEIRDLATFAASMAAIAISLGGFFVKSRVQLTEREQNREDAEQEFQHAIQIRQTEAIEKIGGVLVLTSERLSRLENTTGEILRRLPAKKKTSAK